MTGYHWQQAIRRRLLEDETLGHRHRAIVLALALCVDKDGTVTQSQASLCALVGQSGKTFRRYRDELVGAEWFDVEQGDRDKSKRFPNAVYRFKANGTPGLPTAPAGVSARASGSFGPSQRDPRTPEEPSTYVEPNTYVEQGARPRARSEVAPAPALNGAPNQRAYVGADDCPVCHGDGHLLNAEGEVTGYCPRCRSGGSQPMGVRPALAEVGAA